MTTVVHSQRDVLAWARAVVDTLNIPRSQIDERCGFTERYSNKLLSPNPQKRLAIGSLFALVRGLGHRIEIVPDPDAMALLLTQITTRKIRVGILAVRNGKGKHNLVSKRFLRKIASLGGLASAKRMNPLWRKGRARKAANARWKLYRTAKATKQHVGRSQPNHT